MIFVIIEIGIEYFERIEEGENNFVWGNLRRFIELSIIELVIINYEGFIG